MDGVTISHLTMPARIATNRLWEHDHEPTRIRVQPDHATEINNHDTPNAWREDDQLHIFGHPATPDLSLEDGAPIVVTREGGGA